MKLFLLSFKQAIKSCPAVFKDVSFYFGFYFIGFALLVFFTVTLFDPFGEGSQALLKIIKYFLVLLSEVFTVFMIPYYAYKHSQGEVPPFWSFIGENVWPFVWAYIKAFLLILLFLLLLIIPGIYKAIRYFFLAETVFFDKLYKEKQISALKSADKTTRSYFWLTALLFIFLPLISFIMSLLMKLILPSPGFIQLSVGLILAFYVSCFTLLFKAQFYFELKKQRKEEISCL